jgi:hypothetical protein
MYSKPRRTNHSGVSKRDEYAERNGYATTRRGKVTHFVHDGDLMLASYPTIHCQEPTPFHLLTAKTEDSNLTLNTSILTSFLL